MKIRFVFGLMALIIICFTANGQVSGGKIGGQVADRQNKPLQGVTAVLTFTTDTAIKQTSVTDKNGAFLFDNLPFGTYRVKVSAIGFQSYQDNRLDISATRPTVALPIIILQSAGVHSLKEVTITAKKPLVEQRIDQTIVNVDAMITAPGSNAMEALGKSPGVIIDANDNISLDGKRNVLVLIDGRPTYMSGQDLAAYLRSLPAGLLDKFELLSNPSAKYDASGSAVINIILKKNRAAGFNGGITAGYNRGAYARSNEALNINYRTPKLNLFSNMSYGLDQNYSRETFSRYFYNPGGSLNNAALQNSYYQYRAAGWNGWLGMDYLADSKTTIGFMLNGGTRPRSDLLTYNNSQFNGNMQLDSTGKGYTSGSYQWQNIGLNLNFLHRYDDKGTQLSAYADYIHFATGGNQVSPLSNYTADGSLLNAQLREFILPSNVNIYSEKLDFIKPLANGEFDAGVKSSYVVNDNQLNWFNQAGNQLIPDYANTNHFHYAENINSTYINLKKNWGRWGAQTGLRLENTNASAHQFSNPAISDSAFSKHYTNAFPAAYLSYKLDSAGHHTLVLSYTEKIRRPGYQQLNPFLFYHDQYSYSAGNPNLSPYLNQYFQLKYAYRQFVGVTVGYGIGNNEIQLLTQAFGDVLITRPDNFIDNRAYSLVSYFSFDPAKWWNFRINAMLIYQINNGSAGGVTINQHTNVHEIEAANEFQLGKDWSAEFDGFFPGKQSFAQTQGNRAGYNISGGMRKNIFQGQGSVSLIFNDILHTFYKMESQTIGIDQVSAYSSRETDTRRVGIAFSWHFGKAANARKNSRDTDSAEDEKGRVN